MNAFAYARRSEYIQKDPAELIDKRLLLSMCVFTPPKNDSDRILTMDEMSELRKATIKHEEEYPLYMPDYAIELAMFTGMRVGEISALHWSDIDNDFIRRTVSSQLNTVLSQKDVASILGHSERVNEMHYNYSTAENSLKLQALSQVSSKVISFSALFRTKKIARSL